MRLGSQRHPKGTQAREWRSVGALLRAVAVEALPGHPVCSVAALAFAGTPRQFVRQHSDVARESQRAAPWLLRPRNGRIVLLKRRLSAKRVATTHSNGGARHGKAEALGTRQVDQRAEGALGTDGGGGGVRAHRRGRLVWQGAGATIPGA